MSESSFATGVLVTYKGSTGVITFIDDSPKGYLTICLERDTSMGDLCIVVYRYDWDKVQLERHHKR